ESASQIEGVFEEMERRLRERAGRDGEVRRSFDGRLFGQSWETPFVQLPDGPIDITDLVERFHDTYERRYGNRFPYIPVARVRSRGARRGPPGKVECGALPREGGSPSHSRWVRRIEFRHFADEPLEADEYERGSLPVGAHLSGPAVIREGLATTF